MKAEELAEYLHKELQRIDKQTNYELALLDSCVEKNLPSWADAIVRTVDFSIHFAKVNCNGQFFDKQGKPLRGCTETCTVIYMKE